MTRDGKPFGRRSSDQTQFCPDCHNAVEPGHLESHQYHAHGKDRRATAEQQTPPPPERKNQQRTQPTKDGGGQEQPKKRRSRYFNRPE